MRTPENQRSTKRDSRERWPGKIYFIILFTTIILLIAMTASFFVALAFDGKSPDTDDDGGNSLVNNNTKPIKGQSGIYLPCATEEGSFLASLGSAPIIDGINSESAVLVDTATKTVVAQKNADTVIHPASMSKIMTLLVACESPRANPKALLTVKQEMLDRQLELDGSGELVANTTVLDSSEQDGDGYDVVKSIEIVGKSIRFEDALYLINYQSDTVACLLVAEYIAGSEANFVQMMNKRASEMGLTHTKFVNCTGLTERDTSGNPIDHNRTTAREMAAIMTAVLNNKTAKTIVSSTQKQNTFVYNGKSKTSMYIPYFAEWYNRESRLNGNVKAGAIDIKGGKTGYEDIPDSCFVTYGTHRSTGKVYVCVTIGRHINSTAPLLNNATSTADTRAVYANYAK